MDELKQVFQREIRKLASGILGKPQRTALDCPTKADVRVWLGGQERMFSPLPPLVAVEPRLYDMARL
jgi:hypothetical protein